MTTTYDVFVSHNGLDKPVVERLCWALLKAGLRPWFDKWDLTPGDAWMPELERVLDTVPAVLVCVGAHGLSAWHDAERQAAVDRATSKCSIVLVPVLLPGAPEQVELPVFLRGRQWVDLRAEPAWEAGVARLASSITGKAAPRGPWIDEGRERPYRGLQPFTEADAGWMFGREREEEKLLDALREGQRLITVVGASGSGKSSLVRAGVVPAVRTGAFDGRQRWHALVMRPGTRPCHALAVRLMELRRDVEGTGTELVGDGEYLDELRERLVGSEHALSDAVDLILDRKGRDEQLLLVVDQLEELFTGPGGADSGGGGAQKHAEEVFVAGTKLVSEGAALFRNLLFATSVEGGRVRAILTVRADFTGECLAVPELARRMERMTFALPPMAAEQLRNAIRRPALRVGYDVETALVDVLVGATVDHAGRLPLLQHTLDLLWDVRDQRQHRLTYTAYGKHVGSLEESVANRAERVFAELVAKFADNEAVVRKVFLRLVHLGEGTGDTRRQVRRSELAGDVAAEAVLDEFIEARLLVSDNYRGGAGEPQEQAAEIAHEALLNRWGRLLRWLNENREALRMRQELHLAADEWLRGGQLADELWRGGRLARACEVLAEGSVDLSDGERVFLEASQRADQDALQAESRRQIRLLAAAMTVSTVLLGLLVFAGWQYLTAAQARDEAEQLAEDNAGLLLQKDEEAQKARAATRDEQSARATLLARLPGRELEALQLIVGVFGGTEEEAGAPSVHAIQGLYEVLARTRKVVVLQHLQNQRVEDLAWTADSARLATASGSTARLWDGNTGKALAALRGHNRYVETLAWTAGGTRLATASYDDTAFIWDGTTGSMSAMLKGHTGAVTTLAWTADGIRLATASYDGTARLWIGETGKPLAILQGHTDTVRALAWAPDGTRLATASEDGTVRLWNGKTGESLANLVGHTKAVRELVWAPDGMRLATASRDGTVRLWEGHTGTALATLDGTTHEVMGPGVAWTANGTRLATACDGAAVRLWNSETGEELASLNGHTEPVLALASTSDGTRLATASADHTTRLWDGNTGKALATLYGHTGMVRKVVWTVDGTRLATASADRTARLWDGNTGEELASLGHDGWPIALAWSVDGTRLATGSADGTARIWYGNTGEELATLHGQIEGVGAVAWTADGTRLATASANGMVKLWDGNTGESLAALQGHSQAVSALAWTGDGTRLATASDNGMVKLWDGNTGESLAALQGHTQAVSVLAWSADGMRVATASKDGTAALWDGKTGESLATLQGHTEEITALAWTVDGTCLATASVDETARLWDTDTGESLATLQGHLTTIVALAWTTNGDRLATASGDTTARLWDGKTGKELMILEGHRATVSKLAWASDGERLATASEDGAAKLWDGVTGAALASLQGHTGAITGLAWTADGAYLATASKDATARLWEGKTGTALATFQGHTGAITGLAWTSNGMRLATASEDGTVRLWQGSPHAWLKTACEILDGSTGAIVLNPETKAICAAAHEATSFVDIAELR